MKTTRRTFAALPLAALPLAATSLLAGRAAQAAIDNSAIGQPGFREHKATYGLVYRLPKDVNDVLDAATLGAAGYTAALSLDAMELNGLTPDAGPVAPLW